MNGSWMEANWDKLASNRTTIIVICPYLSHLNCLTHVSSSHVHVKICQVKHRTIRSVHINHFKMPKIFLTIFTTQIMTNKIAKLVNGSSLSKYSMINLSYLNLWTNLIQINRSVPENKTLLVSTYGFISYKRRNKSELYKFPQSHNTAIIISNHPIIW